MSVRDFGGGSWRLTLTFTISLLNIKIIYGSIIWEVWRGSNHNLNGNNVWQSILLFKKIVRSGKINVKHIRRENPAAQKS